MFHIVCMMLLKCNSCLCYHYAGHKSFIAITADRAALSSFSTAADIFITRGLLRQAIWLPRFYSRAGQQERNVEGKAGTKPICMYVSIGPALPVYPWAGLLIFHLHHQVALLFLFIEGDTEVCGHEVTCPRFHSE